ncbi:GNAT family N-acetyltransferase [Ramlibacter tataouinensis]|uniref:GNAT family N-acetyltransferase n=1 Tax=Ramlibacter tataouinensis TaxID=94132 RepID=UPI0022F38204|nr:GNAT family N-acetyltransferase [Ramlibacter tataouinensis]WBY02078.1 GNAT family N-acetyltransferase [Ramlibacter tataouinensis]
MFWKHTLNLVDEERHQLATSKSYGVIGTSNTLLTLVNSERLLPYLQMDNERTAARVFELVRGSTLSVILDLTERGKEVILSQATPRAYADVLYDCYAATTNEQGSFLKGKSRYNLRRARNQLNELGKVECVSYAGREMSVSSFEDFRGMLDASFMLAGKSARWHRSRLRARLDEVVRAPDSVVYELRLDGRPIAMAHCHIVDGNRLVYMTPTYDSAYQKYSPGMQLLLDIADACVLRGGVLDLGKGAADYKSRFSVESYPLFIAVAGTGWLGRPLAYLVYLLVRAANKARRRRHGKQANG